MKHQRPAFRLAVPFQGFAWLRLFARAPCARLGPNPPVPSYVPWPRRWRLRPHAAPSRQGSLRRTERGPRRGPSRRPPCSPLERRPPPARAGPATVPRLIHQTVLLRAEPTVLDPRAGQGAADDGSDNDGHRAQDQRVVLHPVDHRTHGLTDTARAAVDGVADAIRSGGRIALHLVRLVLDRIAQARGKASRAILGGLPPRSVALPVVALPPCGPGPA